MTDLNPTQRLTRALWPATAAEVDRDTAPTSTVVLDEDGQPDPSARYTVATMSGVAFRLVGWTQSWDEDDQEWVDDPEHDTVWAVMVGDDRRHMVDVDDLTLLGDLDYCAECGQVGCEHDGRER